MYRIYRGQLQERLGHSWRDEWRKIGDVIYHIALDLPDEKITGFIYVNLDNDRQNTFVFVQKGSDCARFGHVQYKCKWRRLEKNDNTIVRECKNRFGQKMRTKTKIGNGEGVGQYSLDRAGMKVGRKVGEYDFDTVELAKKTALASKKEREHINAEYARNKRKEYEYRGILEKKKIVEVDTAKIRTVSTVQPTSKKYLSLIPTIQCFPHKILNLSLPEGEKFILRNLEIIPV